MRRVRKKDRGRNVVCFVLALGLCAFSLCTDTCAQTGASVSFTSNIGGISRYGFIEDSLLYALKGTRLYIADITDMANPVELGSVALPGDGRRMVMQNNIIYISCTLGGIAIVDVSNPADPTQLSTLVFDTTEQGCRTFDVAVKDNYAYIADYNGFYVVDVTDPALPALAASFTAFDSADHHAYDVYIDGTYAFVSTENEGLYILDITNPADPQKVSSFKDSEKSISMFYCVVREGNYLYIAGGIQGLVILDITDITDPQLVSYQPGNDYGGALVVVKKDNYVYMTTETTGLYKFDVSDPSAPVKVEVFEFGQHKGYGTWHKGNTIVYGNATFGVRILDIAGESIVEKGSFLTTGRIIECAGTNGYAFASAGHNGLYVLDVTEPSAPAITAHLDLDGYANGLCVMNNTVYIAAGASAEGATGGMLDIIDVSSPAAPAVLGSISIDGEPFDVAVKDGIAYVSTQTKGIALVDVSDPEAPIQISTYDTNGVSYNTALWGDSIIIADGLNGFVILDAADTAFIKKIAVGSDIGTVQDLSRWETSLVLPGGADGLFVFDITALYSPSPIATIEPVTKRLRAGQIKAVDTFNSFLIAADNMGGVRLFDFSDPANPEEVATEEYLHGEPVRISYNQDQNLAYVAADNMGLYIYDVNTPNEPQISVDGRWVGSAVQNGSAVGITAELDQRHAAVTGTVTLFTTSVTQGTISALITDNGALSGSITFDDGQTALCNLTYDAEGKLSGSILAPDELDSVSLSHAGERGLLPLADVASVLNQALAAEMDQADLFDKTLFGFARSSLDAIRGCDALSCALVHGGMSEAMLTLADPQGAAAAAEAYMYPSGYWEVKIAQAVSRNMTDDICGDYQQLLGFLGSQGDAAVEAGLSAAAAGNYLGATSQYINAALYYEAVSSWYSRLKPFCPDFGVATFDGYYEGTVDFGFAMAALILCVSQAEDGTVTGDAYIAVEASGMYIDGVIADCVNTGDTESLVNGTIEVQMGDSTAHIQIIDWKYSLAAEQWEGRINVVEQDVAGNATVKKISDQCPEGWNVHE